MNNKRATRYEDIEIEGKMFRMPNPDPIPETPFVGRRTIIEKALAAWSVIDRGNPLHFRLFGPPGVGKNAIVYELARILNKDLYILNGHEELTPENVSCQAVINSDNMIQYSASPLVAAMLRGGIFFFDEIEKAPVSALDPLASVLDDRRGIRSVFAGLHIQANEGFLFCAALNEMHERGLGLTGFIDERTRPAIYVGYPARDELEAILRAHLTFISDIWIQVFFEEFGNTNISPRNSLTLMKYAFNLFSQADETDSSQQDKKTIKKYLHEAYQGFLKTEEETKTTMERDNEHIFSFFGEKNTVH